MAAARPVKIAATPKATPKGAPEGCQIGELFRLLGEPHVLDLLYILVSEGRPKRFLELQNDLRMSPNTLTSRLKSLASAGLVTRRAFSEIPPRVEYEATAKARELHVTFASLSDWTNRHDLRPEAVIQPAP